MNKKAKKIAKRKSFFFEDYTESQIIIKNKNSNLVKVSLNRITFLFFIFLSLILIFGTKIIYLSLSPEKNFFSESVSKNFLKNRGDIVDRNGIIIARNIDVYSAGVRPQLVNNKKKIFNKFKTYFS